LPNYNINNNKTKNAEKLSIKNSNNYNLENTKIQKNKNEFIDILRNNVHREGIEDLIEFLEKSNFFTTPASSKYHSNYKGGLCEHSLNVYKNIRRDYLSNYSEESIVIVTLLHDLCKVNFYEQYNKSKKDEETNTWSQEVAYRINEKFPYGGHGDKSVFIAERFIRLTLEEALAIKHHMGAGNDQYGESAKAFNISPLALYLFISDTESTFMTESDSVKLCYLDQNTIL
jgi:hypothetical protein